MKLEVVDGSFGYGGHEILHKLNFALEKDTILTILGPNGVGKTTLLKCVMGFYKWKSGETRIDGQRVDRTTEKLFWQKTGYVPQAKQSVFSYQAIDAIIMGLNTQKNFFAVPNKSDYEKAEQVMENLGILKLRNKSCNTLSGGELQMVIMARAMIAEPELLILDEPESNLDMKNQLQVVNTIERISEEFHTACLINTHFPDHALKISDRTLMMGYGGRRILGETRDIVTEENIKSFFDVDSKVIALQVGERKYHTIFPYSISNVGF